MRSLPSPHRWSFQPVLLGTLLIVGSFAHAQTATDDPQVFANPRVEIEALPYGLQRRVADSGAVRALIETPRDGVRTRVWWGRGALEVGAGADLSNTHLAPGLAAGRSGTAVVGLRAELTPGAYLAIERDTHHLALQRPGTEPGADASRVALEFKGVGRSKAANPLSGGLLRMQMSGTSTLQFKPRSGGLSVTYRAKF